MMNVSVARERCLIPIGHLHLKTKHLHCREPLWLVIPSEILNVVVQMLLYGLDYLHNECHVIHTGNNFADPALIFMKNALTFRRPKT
jgi:hypothetical protein